MNDTSRKFDDNSPAYRTIHMHHWFMLAAILLIAVGLGLWMLLGTVQVTLTGNGVYVPGESTVTVHYPKAGIVVDIACTENAYVHAGDELMKIYVCDEESDYPGIAEMRRDAVSVCADTDGYVTEINAEPWERVDVTKSLLHIRTQGENVIRYRVYCSMQEASLGSVKPGETRVKFEPNNDNEDDWIWGTIVQEPFTVRGDYQLTDLVGSGQVAETFMGGEYEKQMLVIELDQTEDGRICYANSGKAYDPSVYAEGKLTIILKEMHPYEKIFLAGR